VRIVCLVLLVLSVPSRAPAQSVDAAMSSVMAPAADAARKKRTPWGKPALGGSASGRPEVLFTFDDGPSAPSTNAVLDVLAAHRVKGIFFMVGHRLARAGARPMVERMLAEGHAVGNHTVDHRDLCLLENRARIEIEIDEAGRRLEEISGMGAVLFRAPYGARCRRLEEALGARGITHMHWDVDPQEWRSHDAQTTQAKIIHEISRLSDGERAVILTHDTKASTAQALEGVLGWIDAENARRRARGRREIRILDPSDVVVEQLAPGVSALLADPTAGGLLPDLSRLFLAPLSARTATSL
jgi:peptidoglycan/xylan/chitin deacetylase (PgdA/CDA1 family)